MGKSDTFENDVLRQSVGQATSLTYPITPYIALFTTAPGETGGGVEVSGGGYTRVSGAGKFAVPSAGSVSNNATIAFPQASGNWGEIKAYGIFTAASGGTLLRYALLAQPQTVNSGGTLSFPSGKLSLAED